MGILGAGKNSRGFTLIELMMGLAVASITMLAIANIVSDQTIFAERFNKQSMLARDEQDFFTVLEQYLTQTTHIFTCDCGPRSSAYGRCIYDPTTSGNNTTAAGATTTLLQFAYEDAADPIINPGPGCAMQGQASLSGSTVTGRVTGIAPRGCKKFVKLTYTAATVQSPGRLELTSLDAANVKLAAISGVTSVGCGITDQNPAGGNVAVGTVPTNHSFVLRVDAKIPAGDNESWIDPIQGHHRAQIGNFEFRNITVPGIMFGKLRQYSVCKPAGSAPDLNAAEQCCSGYYDAGANVCLADSACVAAGTSSGGNNMKCCSRMDSGGVCI